MATKLRALILVCLPCTLTACDPSKAQKGYVPDRCGTDPADPTRIVLTGAKGLFASPERLDIKAGHKGVFNVTGEATHNGKDPAAAPTLCGGVFDGPAGITPLGFALGNSVHPVRNNFRFEVGALVECTAAGFIKRLDNGGDFAKEADVTVGLLVPSYPIPLIGQRSNVVHVRCIGG